MRKLITLLGTFVLVLLGAGDVSVRAQGPSAPIRPEIPAGTVPDEIPGVGVKEDFETAIPADARFFDHEGRQVRFGDYFDGVRPVVLMLVYHQCASFCDMALRGMSDALAQQPWTAGIEYDVVTLSIDPRDTPTVLAEARARTLGRYGREEAEVGWHFIGGTESEIRRVTDAIGYSYQWDERTQQFAHPGVFTVLQPSRRVSRYLYGLEFPFNDVRIALMEASEGRHLPTSEQLIRASLLYCFRWDHADGRYVLMAWRIMRLGGVMTVAVLGGILLTFWRRERKRNSKQMHSSTPDDSGADRVGSERATET